MSVVRSMAASSEPLSHTLAVFPWIVSAHFLHARAQL